MIDQRNRKRSRENYYVSNALAAVAKPLPLMFRRFSLQLQMTAKKNGAAIRLPNGRTLRFAREYTGFLPAPVSGKGVTHLELLWAQRAR